MQRVQEQPELESGLLAAVIDVATGGKFPSAVPDERDEDTLDDSMLVRVVEDLFRRSKDDRYWMRRAEMELNRAFFHTRAWAIWNDASHVLELNPASSNPNAKKLQLNLYTSFIITAAARISASHPVILVHAGTSDQKDNDNALLCQRGLDFEWNRQGMPKIISDAVIPLHLDGSMVQCIEWDPYAGEVVDEAEFEHGAGVPVHEGQIVTRRVDMRHFFSDPNGRLGGNFDDAMWVGEAVPKSCAWIYRTYEESVQPDGWEATDANRSVQHGAMTRNESATVYRVWIAPGRYLLPNGDVMSLESGLVATVAGGKVLERARPNPYDHGMFPYYLTQCIPNDQEPFGETIGNALRSPQVALNKSVNQVIEANDHMAMPVWLEPSSAALLDADFWGLAGIRVRYDDSQGTSAPTRLAGMGASQGVFSAIELLIRAFQMISGQHEGGLAGGSPTNIDSGVGLEALTERDTSRLSMTATNIGGFVKWWGQTSLSLQRQFWKRPRTLTVTGAQMESEVFVLESSAIGKGFDVRVVAESLLPQSRNARLTETLVLLQHGLITIEDARRRVARDQVGEVTKAQQEINLAKNEAVQAETYGQILTPVEQMVLEDHALHLEQHMRDILKPENQPGPNGVPTAWLAFYAHIQLHQRLQWKQMQSQAGAKPADNGVDKPSPGKPTETQQPDGQQPAMAAR